MSFSDPLSDLIIRLKNASAAQHKFVDVRSSKLVKNILTLLKNKGFISDFFVNGNSNFIRVFLRFAKNKIPVLNGVKRLSKPSCRSYVGAENILVHYIGMVVISTSEGVMDGYSAKKKNLGGELLFAIW